MVDELETARDRALKRGEELLKKFHSSPVDNQIEHLAELIYQSVSLDPFGYPNGQPYWSELPDISREPHWPDKERYKDAARIVYNILKHK